MVTTTIQSKGSELTCCGVATTPSGQKEAGRAFATDATTQLKSLESPWLCGLVYVAFLARAQKVFRFDSLAFLVVSHPRTNQLLQAQ